MMMEYTYRKSLVFWGACAGMFLFGVCLLTLGTVTADLNARFGLTERETGGLFAVLPLGIIAGSMLFGPLVDRYGYKGVLIVSCLLLFVGFQGIEHAKSLPLLKGCIGLFGLGGGAINGATNAVVSLVSGEDRVGKLSLLGVFFGIGALGMPLMLAAVSEQEGHQVVIYTLSLATLAVAGFYFWIRFPKPQRAVPFSWHQVGRVLVHPTARAVASFLFLQMGLEAVVNNWTTSYLSGRHGLGAAQALIGLSAFVAGMTAMRILIGAVFHALSVRRLLLVSLALMLVGGMVIQWNLGLAWFCVGYVLLGAGMAVGVPLMLGIVGGLFADCAGTAFSVVIAVGLLGNLGLNYAVGYTAERFGIGSFSHMLLAGWLLMALMGSVVVRRLGNES